MNAEECAKDIDDNEWLRGEVDECESQEPPSASEVAVAAALIQCCVDDQTAELQTIVDKLPKTADGVVVVFGDEVWRYCFHSCCNKVHGFLVKASHSGMWWGGSLMCNSYHVDDCYSTPELAEAAKE